MPIKQPIYQLKFNLNLPEEQIASGMLLSAEDIRVRAETARARLEGGDLWPKEGDSPKVPVWYDQYLKLVYGGWPWRVAVLIAWLAMPKPRWPATQEKLAREVLGLTSDRQFSDWMAKNPAIPAMVQDLRYAMVFDDLGEILAAGIAVAKKQDYKSKGDRELIYKLAGILKDSMEVELPGAVNDLTKLTWEEKLRLAGIDNPEALVALKKKLMDQSLDEEPDEPTDSDTVQP